MCGICGCITNQTAMASVVRALTRLQNRGYDSAGVASISDNAVVIQKSVSKPGENAVQYVTTECMAKVCDIAIGHTRWATHGAKTVENAHPHHDEERRFALIHNGIIENWASIKNELVEHGYIFYGETDTEVVVKYLAHMAKRGIDYSQLSRRLTGTWAILFIDSLNPNIIYFLKNGSPLIFGYNKSKSKIMFVSELSGFDDDIVNYFSIADHDNGYVSLNDVEYEMICHMKYEPQVLSVSAVATSPDPYPHWTLKEISDQPRAIDALLSIRLKNDCDVFDHCLVFPELSEISEYLSQIEHLIFLACGTSYHAAHLGMKFFREFNTRYTTEVIDGADFEETDIPKARRCMMILLSQSGETRDLYKGLMIGKKMGVKSIGIVNVENSLIAREVDIRLYLNAGRENGVASTKSFTNQVIMLLLLAVWMNRNETSSTEYQKRCLHDLKNLSLEFKRVIAKSEQEVPGILPYFRGQNDCFLLGKHMCEWIAREGSLKIKEISYIHSEGYSASALKHGPFALLNNKIPVILVSNDDKHFPKMENVASEVKSRNATVICITNNSAISSQDNIDFHFHYETNSTLFPLISIVPLQMLAYHLALERGNNPDFPRNLAKVVTVE